MLTLQAQVMGLTGPDRGLIFCICFLKFNFPLSGSAHNGILCRHTQAENNRQLLHLFFSDDGMVIKRVLLGEGGGDETLFLGTIGQQQSIDNHESKFQMTEISHVGTESGHAKQIDK